MGSLISNNNNQISINRHQVNYLGQIAGLSQEMSNSAKPEEIMEILQTVQEGYKQQESSVGVSQGADFANPIKEAKGLQSKESLQTFAKRLNATVINYIKQEANYLQMIALETAKETGNPDVFNKDDTGYLRQIKNDLVNLESRNRDILYPSKYSDTKTRQEQKEKNINDRQELLSSISKQDKVLAKTLTDSCKSSYMLENIVDQSQAVINPLLQAIDDLPHAYGKYVQETADKNLLDKLSQDLDAITPQSMPTPEKNT